MEKLRLLRLMDEPDYCLLLVRYLRRYLLHSLLAGWSINPARAKLVEETPAGFERDGTNHCRRGRSDRLSDRLSGGLESRNWWAGWWAGWIDQYCFPEPILLSLATDPWPFIFGY
jgi:hypothetical protein